METNNDYSSIHPNLKLISEIGQGNYAAPAFFIAMTIRAMVMTVWTSALNVSEEDESCPTPLLSEETCHLCMLLF